MNDDHRRPTDQSRPTEPAEKKGPRCPLCGRPRAFLRKFQMCRLCFRKRALQGEITGVIKSSW